MIHQLGSQNPNDNKKDQQNILEKFVTYLRGYDTWLQSQPYPEEEILSKIWDVLQERDSQIRGLESHITKYKAEHSKDIKSIQNLQDKISQMAPNANNTGSNFMLASEFKDSFDSFMKQTLPAAFGPLLTYPITYAHYSKQIFLSVHNTVKNKLQKIIQQISQILQVNNCPEEHEKIKLSNLKFFQDNWQAVFLNNQQLKQQVISHIPKYKNEELVEIQESEEFVEVIQKLLKISAYMLLQQKDWSFVFESDKAKVGEFIKKDYTCIDGWIKQKGRVVFILEAIQRNDIDKKTIRHQNLKNYVIPYPQDSDEIDLVPLAETTKQQPIIAKQVENSKAYNMLYNSTQNPERPKTTLTTEPAVILLYDDKKLKQNRRVLKIDRQNYLPVTKNAQTGIKKVALQQQNINNLQNIPSSSNLSAMLSPSALPKSSSFSLNQNKTAKQSTANIPKQTSTQNNKHSLISDPSFDEIIHFPKSRNSKDSSQKEIKQKARADQLPLRRENNLNLSKAKKSRKSSAGKIIGQNISEAKKDKQNMKNITNKESIYKEMIKSKLSEDGNVATKTQRHSVRQSKEEDRPLRMMHMKKIREKYLNL